MPKEMRYILHCLEKNKSKDKIAIARSVKVVQYSRNEDGSKRTKTTTTKEYRAW